MKRLLGFMLILNCFSWITVHAQESVCNHVLSGLSSEMVISIRDLAKLRLDLDQRAVQGLDDGVTRALKLQFDAKHAEIMKASGLNPSTLSLMIRNEIQETQRRSEADITHKIETIKKEVKEAVESLANVTSLGELKESRDEFTQSELPNGRVVLIGGSQYLNPWGLTPVLSHIELVNPNGKTKKIGRLIEARRNHAASVLPDGRILVTGGISATTILTSIEVIDPNTGKSKVIGDLKKERTGFTQSVLPDGRVLIAGGWSEGRSKPRLERSIEIFNPNTGKMTVLGKLIEPRYEHTQSVLPDGRVIIVGGGTQKSDFSSIELIDPSTGKIELIGHLNDARSRHTQSILPDGRIIVAGGRSDSSGYISSIEVIDVNARTVEKIGYLEEPRYGHAQSTLPDGRVIVSGGIVSHSIEVIDPATGKSELIGYLKEPRSGHTQFVRPDGQVLILGGARDDRSRVSLIELIQMGRK